MTFESLYKYTKWDKQFGINCHHCKILNVPEIYFTAPSQFNDPFDCQLSRGWHLKSNEEILNYLRTKHPNDKDQIDRVELWLTTDREDYIRYLDEADIKLTDMQSGVFCLAANPTNSLLWAHYAGGHQGLCLGFHTAHLSEQLESHCENKNLQIDCIPVEYREELPDLEPFLENDRQWFLQRYRYKAKEWSYEQEYRFVLIKNDVLDNAERAVKISPDCISEVVLGCEVDRETEVQILDSIEKLKVSNQGLRTRKAIKSKEHFKYELIEL